MTYKEFEKAVISALSTKCDYSITSTDTQKNNGVKYRGITIKEDNTNMGVTLYLDGYYLKYRRGKSIDILVEEIMQSYQNNVIGGYFDIDNLLDWSISKQKVLYKLINKELNSGLLNDIPYVEVMDLIKVFYVPIDESPFNGEATILLHNNILDSWNISIEELEYYADVNTEERLPAMVMNVTELLKDKHSVIELPEVSETMYVITNTEHQYGAGAILYDGVLDSVADIFNTDIYVLPSSIHETIAVSVDNKSIDEVLDIVVSVNKTELSREEILADSVYHYDMNTKQLTIVA